MSGTRCDHCGSSSTKLVDWPVVRYFASEDLEWVAFWRYRKKRNPQYHYEEKQTSREKSGETVSYLLCPDCAEALANRKRRSEQLIDGGFVVAAAVLAVSMALNAIAESSPRFAALEDNPAVWVPFLAASLAAPLLLMVKYVDQADNTDGNGSVWEAVMAAVGKPDGPHPAGPPRVCAEQRWRALQELGSCRHSGAAEYCRRCGTEEGLETGEVYYYTAFEKQYADGKLTMSYLQDKAAYAICADCARKEADRIRARLKPALWAPLLLVAAVLPAFAVSLILAEGGGAGMSTLLMVTGGVMVAIALLSYAVMASHHRFRKIKLWDLRDRRHEVALGKGIVATDAEGWAQLSSEQ